MIRRFFIYFSLIFAFMATTLSVLFSLGFSLVAVPVSVSEPAPRGVVLLVPLDSRPPCTDYVASLARMAGFQILQPPKELLDDYRRPGNASGMREWLQQNISRADSAIISVDMLVHGGLLASRKGLGSVETAEELMILLRTLHENHPQVKLYAFNIIPRLLISDDPHTEKYKLPMAEWSILQETTALFENPKDILRLQTLEKSIPADIPARYRKLYAENHRLNQQLIALTKTGVLAGLVLGQDDSAPFGLANMERQRLENEISTQTEIKEKIYLTRGTDEVALTLLCQATGSAADSKQKVYVHYTEEHTADAILPYMPRPLSQTVSEKLALGAADTTELLSEADYILVVHAGSPKSDERRLKAEANQIKEWLAAGYKVALVDLATDWIDKQTMLPYLQRNGTLVHQLSAYAGWNTASNSVGTAVTQATMVLRGHETKNFDEALYRDIIRAGFLSERIVDDWYYQKIYRHQLNDDLQKQQIDPYDLKLARQIVTRRINHQIYNATLQYIRRDWRNAVFTFAAGDSRAYAVDRWEIRSGLPWDRTFEIFVGINPAPALIIQK